MTNQEQDELQQAEIRAGIVKAPVTVSNAKVERKEFTHIIDGTEWGIGVIRKSPDSPWVFGAVYDHHHMPLSKKEAEVVLDDVRNNWNPDPNYCADYAD